MGSRCVRGEGVNRAWRPPPRNALQKIQSPDLASQKQRVAPAQDHHREGDITTPCHARWKNRRESYRRHFIERTVMQHRHNAGNLPSIAPMMPLFTNRGFNPRHRIEAAIPRLVVPIADEEKLVREAFTITASYAPTLCFLGTMETNRRKISGILRYRQPPLLPSCGTVALSLFGSVSIPRQTSVLQQGWQEPTTNPAPGKQQHWRESSPKR